ncbi:PAS domain S-box protein [Methylobacterium aerolatum]|uniref:histidine kinase n=1 Tax=Methylobacterium aerolatum TaxID=418708 RepID=A0ABU0I694_9HYPH|nr:PAS domain S-box protein [Methylobacterium aerolatum]MDQ0449607.1 PAS domain S-box-containing protein [Methylobacterium aerolatum]GJD36104.1 Sensor histidine kinase RcsC [Methylobacterium aerolatum]
MDVRAGRLPPAFAPAIDAHDEETMDAEIERLRRRERELEDRVAMLEADRRQGVRRPDHGQRTSAASADLLFTAAEKTRMPQIITDPNQPDNPIVFANRAFQSLCGYDASELIGRNCRFLQGPDTDPADVAKVRDAIAGRRDVVVELTNYHRDGTPFRNELYISPVFGPDGSLRYFFASQLDVTRFRTAEGILAESESRYRALFDAVDSGFCIVEMRFDAESRPVDYRFVEVNPAFAAQTGLHGVAGRWVSEVVPGLERFWFDTYGEVARTGRPVRFESGAVSMGRWFDVHALRVGEPELHRVAILFNDITDRRRLESHLETAARERTDERDMVWRASRDLFVVCGFDGHFRKANAAWTQTLGWEIDEVVGARFDHYVNLEDRAAAAAAFERVIAGLPIDDLDVRMRAKDGSVRWISWNAIPTGDHFYAAGRDITERRALEEQLRQSQKLEAVGQLTGGVAHDFNNLLTVIKSSTDLLKRADLAEERRQRYVGAISDTVDRAAKLTGQLLAFARRQALRPETFAVDRAVTAVADMVRTLTGARVHITLDLPTGEEQGLHVNADPSQFDTALVNLVVNARDAMAGEGNLRIRLRRATTIPAIRAHPLQRGDFVAVAITDSGSGIAPENMERIFEPFFTTKGVGQGTGLGLSQVFGFAKQSGGEITVESEVGTGTTFTLFLPRVAVAQSSGPAAEPEPLAEGHGTRVLVVEDNLAVGAFAEQALRELGYTTVWVTDAATALAEIERVPFRFEVVFSDVVMPGMNGVELADEIRRRRPDIPVVLTSGYSDVLAVKGTHGFDLLRKPYSVADLSRILRRAVQEARGRRGAAPPLR